MHYQYFILATTTWGFLVSASREDLIQTLKYRPDAISKQSILRDHMQKSDEFYNPNDRYDITQLAYITPWNAHGYELATSTAHKLTHVSPVWFQVKADLLKNKNSVCQIEGSHDINRTWITEMIRKNPRIKIIPRILFDDWSQEEFQRLLYDVQFSRKCFKTVAEFFSRNQFHGAVVEFYTQALFATQSLSYKELIIESLEQLAKEMIKHGLLIVVTVPAPLEWNDTPNNLVTSYDYKKLISFSDFVQIMTYDYRGDRPTGVAPYDWMEKCVLYLQSYNSKTLVGLNYYGYSFSTGSTEAISSKRFLENLRDKKTVLEFDENCMEHRLITSTSVVYFPSLTSIELRTNLAHRYHLGIAIWEYGQGLDYFTNLLV